MALAPFGGFGMMDPFSGFDQAFDRAFSRAFGGMQPGFGTTTMMPALTGAPTTDVDLFRPMGAVGGAWHIPMDIIEKEHGFEVIADAPGMNPDEVKIEVLDNVLTISGEHKEKKEEKDKAGRVVRSERVVRRFNRSFTLPETANQDAIAAHLDKGVLRVCVPKMPAPEKPQPKRISVAHTPGTTAAHIEGAGTTAGGHMGEGHMGKGHMGEGGKGHMTEGATTGKGATAM